jgi:endonuclease-8
VSRFVTGASAGHSGGVPEGDTVWLTARRLHQALAGQPLVVAELRWPSVAELDLRGRGVASVSSRGKHLLIRLDDGLSLHSHLRMEGSWRLHRTGTRAVPGATSDVRAVLGNAAWTAVGYRLGLLDAVPTEREQEVVGHLGPDLLGPDWDRARVLETLGGDPGRTVGESLLDQRVLAGIGTFWLAETLFLRGLTPWTPVGEVADPGRLLDLVRRMMTMSINGAPQVTTGDTRRGQTQWVHARSGRPCRRCGTTIRVAPLGDPPRERPVFYCPRCQRGPAPTDDGAPQRPLGAGTVRTGRATRREL